MGSNQSAVRLPAITREHWHQVPLPSTVRRKSSHGHYKLFQNVLTNERIEQYTVNLQGDQFDQYIKFFSWRQQEEHIVASRYFQSLKDETFCGSRVSAQVYIQHSPYRLSDIHDIPLQESLYVLSAAFVGFQKLFGVAGGFRPSEDMIGIDCEGRIKVWLNPNFSRNTLINPFPSEQPYKSFEGQMVMEIIALVQQNTAYQQWELRLLTYFQQRKDELTFQLAQQLLEDYSKKQHIPIPKYFVSILRILQQKAASEEQSHSETHDPFRHQHPFPNNTSVVHYINPALLSNPLISQTNLPSKEQLRSLTRIEHEDDGKQTSRRQIAPHAASIQTIPRVNFNYSSRKDLAQPAITQKSSEAQTPHFRLPLNKIAESFGSQTGRAVTRRVTYSDMSEDYQLDQELAEDLVRFFNN